MSEKELDIRKNDDLVNAINLADSIVYKTYHSWFNQMEIAECPPELRESVLNDFVRFFKIERFVYKKNENNRDKLVSVFHAIASCGGSVIVLINSDSEKIDYYFGTKVAFDKNIRSSAEILNKSLSGNFPGTKIVNVPSGSALDRLTDSVFKNHKHSEQLKQIYTITGVAGLRSKDENHEKLFIQGMEKLIDSMRGETYSLLLIADPVSPEELQVIKRGYENLYSQLIPFASSELNFGQNESASVSNSITEGLSKSINKSVTETLTHTEGTSESHTEGITKTKGMNVNPGGLAGLAGGAIGFALGGPLGMMLGGAIGGAIGGTVGFNSSTSKNESDTTTKSKSVARSKALTDGTTETTTEQETNTTSKTDGTSRNIQIKFENKAVKNLLEKIDLQLKRLDVSADTGMWNSSVYCLADNTSTCKIVASSYQSILRGENSSLETGTITEWETLKVNSILPWLEKMHHPLLLFNENKITPSSFLSGTELAIHAGLPGRSVGGLPVLEMAPFGREVQINRISQETEQYGNKISLGKIYHMGKEENLPVILDKKSLASHTFITGSTGSGKSNAVYNILDEILKTDGNFLVIEPAKGEYKHVFGNSPDVSVYGTNPEMSPLLRINPFSFIDGIHILEHLDRLVEIFNVCWPMYAAMPAVLKDAIEVSYEESGWDLRTSTNKYPVKLYPGFSDIVANIRRIIDTSEYSEENKGNYKGALVTRLKSLTNGINGLIFNNNEIDNEELFDKNVIVDLSRVGSMETKALIMGVLVVKLQEYRMISSKERFGKSNSDLRHITVLEEAHNLLKRTSMEQASETANLLGKSVEMIANAIAEMRTYGEGFVIADQAPGLLDLSVIRNTNTKIILRLPDESDRELVGRAAGLNEDQIVELARLQCGVAAVYQNDWIQPVLCKVNYYKASDIHYTFDNKEFQKLADTSGTDDLRRRLTLYLLSSIINEPPRENIDGLKQSLLASGLDSSLKSRIIDFISHQRPPDEINSISDLVAGLYDYEGNAIRKLKEGGVLNIDNAWSKMLFDDVSPRIDCFPEDVQMIIMNCIITEISRHYKNMTDLPEKWVELGRRG
jgi:DNA helicase HerA-like ATPase